MTTFSPTPTHCDLCRRPLQSVMYDAAIRGQWGCVCPRCFAVYGGRLGTGLGQKYRRNTEGVFVKVEG